MTSYYKDPLIHYRSAGLRYWIIFLRNGFNTESASNKEKHIRNSDIADYLMSALNSNLFWWYYSTNYDMFNLTESNIFDFTLNYDKENNVKYYIDSSNAKDKYTRNRYRKHVLPFLKEEEKDVHLNQCLLIMEC